MVDLYACLAGNWVRLKDDPNCKIDGKTPSIWWEEGASIYTTALSENEEYDEKAANPKNSFYYQNYVNIIYLGKRYRVNPIFLQIVGG